MKRYLSYLLFVIVSIIIPFSVFAEKVSIEDTVIKDIKIPENWKLITRNNLDEMVKWLGYDTKKANEYKYDWLKYSYYADIVSEEKNKEIILTKEIKDFYFDDLSIYPDEVIMAKNSKLQKEYKDYKSTITLYITASGIKYYKIKYEDEENSLYFIEYLTSVHGNIYKLNYKSNMKISSDDITFIETIINSIEYDNYSKFIKNNKIEIEEKKDTGASSIIAIFIMIIIIVIAIVIYIKLTKNKKMNKQNSSGQVYKQANKEAVLNPSITDFLVKENNSESDKNKNNT